MAGIERTPDLARRLTTAAVAFLKSLSVEQLQLAHHPFADAIRYEWSYAVSGFFRIFTLQVLFYIQKNFSLLLSCWSAIFIYEMYYTFASYIFILNIKYRF